MVRRARRWAAWSGVVLGLLLASCRDSRTQRVEVDLEARPSRLQFGPTALGLPRTMDVSLTNRSRASIEVTGFATSAQAIDVEGGPFTLEPGSEIKVKVRFAPEVEGAVTGQLEIRTNNGGEGGQAVLPVDGFGVRALVEVGAERLDFGPVELGTVKVLELPVRNPTAVPAPLELIIEGPEADEFAAPAARLGVLLEPGESRGIPLSFHPNRLGTAEARVKLGICEGCEARTLELTGTGIASALEVTPLRVDFGRVALGARAEQKIRVGNLGTEPISLRGASLLRGTPEFDLVPVAGQTLAPGASVEITVGFRPTRSDPVSELLHLDLQAGNTLAGGVKIPLTGEGGSSCLLILPRKLDFGVVAEGMSVTKRVDIHNRCLQQVEVSNLAVRTDDGGFFTLNQPATAFTVPANGASSLHLSFQPKPGAGKSTGGLTFDVNEAGARASDEVKLLGEGRVFPECSYAFEPGALDFGKVTLGSAVLLGLTLENTGSTPCFLGGMQLAPGTDAAFSTYPVPAMILGPTERAVLPITFRPTTKGKYSGLGEAFINHGTQNHPTALLTGEGVEACLTLQPATVDFGVVKTTCGGRTRRVQARNACTTDVTLTSAQLAVNTSPQGELKLSGGPGLPLTLAPGQQVEFDLTYAPVDDGADTAALRVASSLGGFHSVGLIGRGTLRGEKTDVFYQRIQSKVDVLFVIDNSGSMMEEQQNLAQNFAAFLSSAQALYVDYQIGVTTTGLTPSPGGWSSCPGGVQGGEAGRLFPVTGGGPRIITPATPDAAKVFANNVQVGWCHWNEQGLEAAYRALSAPLLNNADDPRTSEPNDGNLGFLRTDAKLAIVVLTDEEDFSPNSVAFYETYFRSLKGNDPAMVSVSAIAGPEDLGQCPTASSSGTRYIELARNTGGVVENICTSNWAGSLQKLSTNAFGPNKRFPLSEQPADPPQFRIEVDGVPVTHGWRYDPLTRSIVFDDAFAPTPGSSVSITYQLGC